MGVGQLHRLTGRSGDFEEVVFHVVVFMRDVYNCGVGEGLIVVVKYK